MSGGPLLVAHSLDKSFGRIHALHDVSVSVDAGEIVCLLGPNGAGKTTLTSVLAGLLVPDRGEVRVSGIDVLKSPQRAHELIGLAPQETGVYPMLDVEANLRFFCEVAGLRRRAVTKRISELVDALLLDKLLRRPVHQLSGGERRRLHLAIALVHEPQLLLLDEPTVGSDIVTRRRVLTVIRELAAQGCGILYSSHYLGEVEELNGFVIIMNAGTIVTRGTLREIIPNDETAVVELVFKGRAPTVFASGFGDANVVHVTCADDVIRITTRDVASTLAEALGAIAPATDRLQGISTLRPSLDDLVVSLTSDERSDGGRDQ